MNASRHIDVINVNRMWTVYVGSRACGYSIGTVKAADRLIAMRVARTIWPDPPRIFVDEF